MRSHIQVQCAHKIAHWIEIKLCGQRPGFTMVHQCAQDLGLASAEPHDNM